MFSSAGLCLHVNILCVVFFLGHIAQVDGYENTECVQPVDYTGNRRCGMRCNSNRDCKGRKECLCDGECGKSCVNRDIKCHPEPTTITHGRVSIKPQNQFEAIATYQCDDGFYLVGVPARICQGDGTWKGEPPRCEVDHSSRDQTQYCGPPPSVTHADRIAPRGQMRFKLGTKLIYECDTGFTKQTASVDSAWCVRGGTWVGPQIICESSGCTTPPNIANGYVEMQTKSELGAVVRYMCQSGYFLVGQAERTCGKDGTWNGHEPSCELVVCGPPPTVEHAEHDAPKNQYRFMTGKQLVYTCQHGYYREGSQRAICSGAEGQWKGPNMSCRARDCGAPGDITHGWRDPGYRFTYPTKVTYHCNEGYELRGKYYRECKADGEWSGVLPECEPIECDELGPPLHGTRIGSRTVYGSTIKFVCNNGYKVVGSAERSCQADGAWSGKDAFCDEIHCGVPGPLHNGYLDGHRTNVGGVYFYRCNIRTKFNGTSFSTQCLENGQWSAPIPVCLGQCQVPSIYNGTIAMARQGVWVDHGTVIEPKCENGLVINDSRPVTCNNGTWTIIPRCVPAPCSKSPPQIENGHRVFFSLAHGAQARYFCFAGYRLVDKVQFLKCEFGKWLGAWPQCKEQFCPHPGNLENGRILKIGIKGQFLFSDYIYTIRHGERLMYECNRDHRLVGPRGAACVNGRWSPQAQPKCLKSRHPVFNKLWRPIEEKDRHTHYY